MLEQFSHQGSLSLLQLIDRAARGTEVATPPVRAIDKKWLCFYICVFGVYIYAPPFPPSGSTWQ